MFDFMKDYPEHIKKAFYLTPKIKLKKGINKIVVGGMGGSAISGDILKNYLEDEISIPIFVARRYKMPKFVDKKTLVFMISYSGNTEESLSMLEDAKKKGAQIVLLTSDGKFAKKKFPIIKVPQGLLPRVALPYLFFPLLKVLQDNGIIGKKDREVKEVSRTLKNFRFEMAKEIAKKFFRRTPVLYGPEIYRCALYRWQTQLNENSKKFAHFNCFTEMNHNEIVSDFEDNKDIFAVIINDPKIYGRIKLHIKLAEKILSKEIEFREVRVKGNNVLARIFYVIYLGDCVSYYLAELRSVDPAETSHIKFIKDGLKRGK